MINTAFPVSAKSFDLPKVKDSPLINRKRIDALDQDFSINTKPYILSNESNREKTYKVLTENPASPNGFHVGFSCWENLDIIAMRRSCGGILADISNMAHEFHETVA